MEDEPDQETVAAFYKDLEHDPDLLEILKSHPKYKNNPGLLMQSVAQYQAGGTLSEPVAAPSLDETISSYQEAVATSPAPEPEQVDNLSQVPNFMRIQKRWTVFRRVWNEERGKFDKIVCTPVGGTPYAGYPNTENQTDFGHFTDIKKLCELDTSFVPAYYILKTDGLLFLDYDAPCNVPNFPTYTERSISGGYHVLGWYKGVKPGKLDTKEAYQDRRWIVMTGDVVGGKVDINDVNDIFTPSATPAPGQFAPSFKVPEKIGAGERNTVLFKLACSLRKKGLSELAMTAAIHAENQVRCEPPLPDDEIMSICSSAGKYPQGGGQSHPHNTPPPTGGGTCHQPACGQSPIEIPAAESAGELRDRGDQAISAIATVYNTPDEKLFIRKNEFVRVTFDEDGVPMVQEVNHDGLTSILASCVNWYKKTFEKDPVSGKEVLRRIDTNAILPRPIPPELKPLAVTTLVNVPSKPPREIIEYITGKGHWDNLPPLRLITECPYITEDGTIIAEEGYNWDNRIYLALEPDFGELEVPENPTAEDVAAAKDLLFGLYSDFKFEDEASRQNNIACLITSVIRPLIPGVVPLFAFDKPVMGAGASLLGEMISATITNRPSTNMPTPKGDNPEEWNKFILSCVRSGRSFFILDNIDGQFYNAALASVLTSSYYGGRLLGVNEIVGYPNVATWICNGNNLVITGDLPRRTVYIRLIADVERPYERTDFKIPEILSHVTEHRADYIAAVLTIVRAWIQAGRPKTAADLQVMGGYEGWRKVVGGIMNFIGCSEFLKNTKKNLELSEVYLDEEAEVLAQIYAIQKRHEENVKKNPLYNGKEIHKEFTTKEIADYLIWEAQGSQPGYRELGDTMPDKTRDMIEKHPKGISRSLASLFGHMKGRVFPNGYRLDQAGAAQRAIVYRITSREERQKAGGANAI